MTTAAYTHGGAPRKPEPPQIVIVKDGPLGGAPWWWWVGLVAAYVAGYLQGVSTLSVEFAFEIGEVVYFKTAPNTLQQTPRRHTIVERVAQQCPGGVQLQYRLGNWDAKHLTNEIELSREMPPYERSLPERRQESSDLRKEDREESRRHWDAAIASEAAKSE